jgi:hypothetical protein
MKRMHVTLMTLAALMLAGQVWAAAAATSANAGTNGRGNGTAAATATYTGDQGFARTDTQTGRVNLARGVAVGVDERGVSISVSNAIAPHHGPAIATNFNLTIGRDGSRSVSIGAAVSPGPGARSAGAGGSTAVTRTGTSAMSTATGTSDGGKVRVMTRADDRPAYRPAPVVRYYRR